MDCGLDQSSIRAPDGLLWCNAFDEVIDTWNIALYFDI